VGFGTLVVSVFLTVLPVQARTTTDRIDSGLNRISDDNNGSRRYRIWTSPRQMSLSALA
jgi:hypothetical protein